MSEPRPVAWRTPSSIISATACHQVQIEDDSGSVWSMAPADADAEAVALIMAAAVARGEQGHAAALNRVVVALGSPEPHERMGEVYRRALNAINHALGEPVAELATLPKRIAGMHQQLRDALHMAEDAPWGLLVDTAARLRGDVEAAREAQQDAEDARAKAVQEATRLRVECDEVALACGVATVAQVPAAWGSLTAAAERVQDYNSEACAAMQKVFELLDGPLGAPTARGLAALVRGVVDERDRMREQWAEVRKALGIEGTGSVVAAVDALRAELAEARASLSGKTMHDAAAEVVAPLRNDIASREPDSRRREHLMTCAPADVVSVAIMQLRIPMRADTPTHEVLKPLAGRLGIGSGVSPAFIVGEALKAIPTVRQAGEPGWCKCDAPDRQGAWCYRCAAPTREPMTHHSLASIEQHGVVVGDRLAWVGRHESKRMVESVCGRWGLESAHGDPAPPHFAPAADFPLVIVEAPDAD